MATDMTTKPTTFNDLKPDNITEVLEFLTPNRNKEIEDLKEELRRYKDWFKQDKLRFEAIVRHCNCEYRQLDNGVWRRRHNRKKMDEGDRTGFQDFRASIRMIERNIMEEAKYAHLKRCRACPCAGFCNKCFK